jgi:hypothetical protein
MEDIMKNKGSITQQIKALKRSIKKFGPGNDNSKLIALAKLEGK